MKSNEYYKDPCTNEPNKGNPKKETNIGLPSIHKNQIYEMQAACKYIINPLFQRKKNSKQSLLSKEDKSSSLIS